MRRPKPSGRTLAIALAAALLLSYPAQAARFVDTSGSWTEKSINFLSDKGVIAAEPDGKFKPDEPVTRAVLAGWLVKVLGIDGQPVSSKPSFPDVKPTDWFFKPVEIIRQNNYISGYPDGFRPNQFIQKAEVISIIARTLNMAAPTEEQAKTELAKYKDGNTVPAWAKNGIAQASAVGILPVGPQSDMLKVTSIATRGETASLLAKLDEYMARKTIESATAAGAGGAAPPQGASAGAAQGAPAGSPQGAGGVGGYPQGYPYAPPGYYAQPQYQGQVTAQGAYSAPPAYGAPPAYPQYQPPPQYAAAPPAYAPPGYMAGQGQFAPYNDPSGRAPLQGGVAVLAAGTQFKAKLKNSLDSGSTQAGEEIQAVLGEPVFANGQEVIPAGAKIIGSVTNVVSAARFKFGANGKMDIRFTSIEMPDGRRFPLQASVDDTKALEGGTMGGRIGKGLVTTGVGAAGGAALGTALGAIVGATSGGGRVGMSTGMGAVFGTALGAGVGGVGAVVRKGSEAKLPAGMSLNIQLDQSLQITGIQQAYRGQQAQQPYGQPGGYPAPAGYAQPVPQGMPGAGYGQPQSYPPAGFAPGAPPSYGQPPAGYPPQPQADGFRQQY